jgi:Na+-driven multidrug efflux pump
MTAGFILCEAFAEFIVQAFTTDAELIQMAAHGMRIDVALFPIIGFQMVTGNFFQSIEQAGKSIYLSLTPQLIFLVPCLLILPGIWGLDGVWISLPVSDGLASLNAAVLLYLQIQKFKAHDVANTASSDTSWTFHLLRLPRRIQFFAANRVAPYLPLFSMFQPEDKEDETNRTP